MTLTSKQRTVLVQLSDGAERSLMGLSNNVTRALWDRRLIKDRSPYAPPVCSMYWEITPDGLTALEAAQ